MSTPSATAASAGYFCRPLHPPYSILRPAVKHDVIPWCAAHNVGVISYLPLFGGLLFGTWQFARLRRTADSASRSCALACCSTLQASPLSSPAQEMAGRAGYIANLGVSVTPDQASAVWTIAGRLAKDLEGIIPAPLKVRPH